MGVNGRGIMKAGETESTRDKESQDTRMRKSSRVVDVGKRKGNRAVDRKNSKKGRRPFWPRNPSR